EQEYYNLDDELLKPVNAISPWSPGDAASGQRDKALFSATSGTVGGMKHSLASHSFPESVSAFDEMRAARLSGVHWGWVGLALAALALGYTAVWLYLPLSAVWQVHFLGVALLLVPVVCVLTMLGMGQKATYVLGVDDSKSMREEDELRSDLRRGTRTPILSTR